MMGMFGMAQVIGARSLGINVLTDKDTKWPPPKLTKTQLQIIDSWSLDVARPGRQYLWLLPSRLQVSTFLRLTISLRYGRGMLLRECIAHDWC